MSVKAIIKVTLEIEASSSWGNDCMVSQVKRQSLEDVENILAKALEKSPHYIKSISKPECISIIYKE